MPSSVPDGPANRLEGTSDALLEPVGEVDHFLGPKVEQPGEELDNILWDKILILSIYQVLPQLVL